MNVLQIILPITALLISVFSLIISSKNNKRQIRVNKLEELLEINLFLLYHYEVLLEIYKIQCEIRKPNNKNGIEIMNLQKIEDELIHGFFEIVGRNTFTNKLIRLEVLSRSYLPSTDAKLKILYLADLYLNLSSTTLFKDYEKTKVKYESYPDLDKIFEYVEDVENEIILQMKLGYKILSKKEFENYKNRFKKDLNIK